MTTARILDGFDDPALAAAEWQALASAGSTDEVFQSLPWLRTWWDCFGRGQLLLVLATCGGRATALAPLFACGGTGYFVGAGGSDYLDFLGDTSDPQVLAAMLAAARAAMPDFQGFQFHLVPDDSPTGARLQQAAARLELELVDEGALPAPWLALDGSGAAEQRTLVRRERWFQSHGQLTVRHLRTGAEVEPHLDEFFAQHVERWQGTPHPSLFLAPAQRAFYRAIAHALGTAGSLRFTRVDWNGSAIAFHFGFRHGGSYLWYKPTYAVEHARHSPGAVLLRNLLLSAVDEGARRFDFGIGDEPFKARYCDQRRSVRTWRLQ